MVWYVGLCVIWGVFCLVMDDVNGVGCVDCLGCVGCGLYWMFFVVCCV